MKRILLVIAPCVLILAACAPSAEAVNTAIAQTQAANPTSTHTAQPASTETPTLTSTPTRTITPTKKPTKTRTVTPEPATQTVIAFNLAATKQSRNATSTQAAAVMFVTRAAYTKSAEATRIAQYQPIDLRELVTYPDNHKGEKVVIRGRIFNINRDVVQIWVLGYEAVYIEMQRNVSGIYEDDYITVYGTVYGSWCFTNAVGNETCQPAIYDAWYEKK